MKNNINIFSIITCMVALICNSIHAQGTYTEPAKYVIAPTAADLGKYGCIPVSYYTGQADISIPLYSTNQLGVPFQMSMSYDGSGQLLNKLPGWTGHNWSLIAGGIITRAENGQADEWWYDSNKYGRLGESVKFGHFYNRGIASKYVSYMKRKHNNLGQDWSTFGVTAEPEGEEDYWNFWAGDTEPDVFCFNFCGKTGRFFLGDDGEWKVYSEDNIKVLFDIDDNSNYILPFSNMCNDGYTEQSKTIKGFTLVDENGTKYVFGGDQSSIDYSIPSYGLSYFTKSTTWHACAWHLTSIEDRLGNELYSFKYEHGYFVTHANYGKTKELSFGETNIRESFWTLGGDSGWSFSEDNKDKYNFSFSLPTYLKSIQMQDGTKIDFYSSRAFSTNATAYPYLYDKRYFSQYKPKEINSENFNSSFFYEDYSSIVGAADAEKRYCYLNTDNSHQNFDEYRYLTDWIILKYDPFSATGLKCLDSIKVLECGKLTRIISLEYNEKAPRMHITKIKETDANGNNGQTHEFSYKGYDKLPKDYSSPEYDYWGYYGTYREQGQSYWTDRNGNVYSSAPLETTYDDRYHAYIPKLKDGVTEHKEVTFERKCSSEKTQYGTLSEIRYPTGGRAVFEFEQNDYACYRDIMTGDWCVHYGEGNQITGGLRIKSISLYTDTTEESCTSRREFSYEKGGKSSGELSQIPHWAICWHPKNSENVTMTSIHNSENPLIPLQNSFGPHVGYTRVEELCDGIRTVYEYSNYSNTPKDEKYLYYFQNQVTPYDRYTEIGFCRGRLLSKTVYDKNGKKAHETLNVYRGISDAQKDYTLASHVRASYVGINSLLPYFQYYIGGIYKIYYPKYDVASQTEKLFYNNGKDSVVNTTLFDKVDYDGCRLTRCVTQKSNIGKHGADHSTEAKTEYAYAFDYFGKQTATDNPITSWNISVLEQKFKENHFYPVISSTKSFNQVCQSTERHCYKLFGGKVLPSAVYCTLGKDSITNYTQYQDYNALGLPTRMKQKDMPRSYLYWDGQFIQAIVTAGDTTKVPNYTSSDNPLKCVQIGGVPAYQAAESQTVVVRYGDNKRIKSITDGYGLTNFYGYDGLGRLSTIRNKENKCVSSFSYHVKDNGYNYVKTSTMLNATGTDSLLSVQYYDGFGRPALAASNAANPNNRFAYTLTEYDSFGRETKTWAPVVGSVEPTGSMAESFASESIDTYNDAYGYTKTEYDAIGRVVKTTRPGKDWHTNRKSVSISYGINNANNVKKYASSPSGDKLTFGYYAKGDLSCTTTTDEDKKSVAVFKDCRGLTVLERRSGLDTYYVYDEIGQLRFVLQPMYKSEASLDKFAFQYTYDGHGRVASKKLPGCQPITYEYDGITDRVAKMQDGLLRAKGKFRTYEYDGLGRMTRQSISSGGKVEYDEIINYYDDYNFLTDNTMTCEGPVYYYLKKNSTGFHGQLTGTQQRASNGEELLTVYAYDDHGRIIRKGEIGLDGYLSVSESEYNFVGDIVKEDFTEYELDGNVYEFRHEGHITNNFDIPHTKLPTSSVIHLYEDNEATQMTDTIFKYTYDDFGHVIANNRSGTAGDMTYEYDNLHGWVKRIASAKNFEQRLYRETEGQNKRWNGSISAMTWKTDNNTLRRYDYTYDGMNRLTRADYSHYAIRRNSDKSETFNLIPDDEKSVENYSEQFQYDRNSNIKWLARWGYCTEIDGYDTADVLDIEYNGNQKKSMVNACFEADYYGSMQCVDGACEDVEYAYDGNGNLIQDQNKGQTYEYDLLGHPSKVNGKTYTIEYVYAPDGRKLRTVHKTYTSSNKKTIKTSTTKDYTNGYIFTNGKPSMFSFDGGYYSFDGQGKLNGCRYYIQDYQGNNREVVNAATNFVEQINHYYSYGGLIGDISTKPNTQDFKYGGKELDLSNGLNLYDFEARQYDAVGGPNFTSVDQHSESYYGISPYAYCAGDPINCIDPTGMDTLCFNQSGQYIRSVQNSDGDVIVIMDSDGNIVNQTRQFAYGTVKRFAEAKNNKNKSILSVKSVDGKETSDALGTEIFEFMADNTTGAEWGQIKTGKDEFGDNYVSTKCEKQGGPNSRVISMFGIPDGEIREIIHSHPDGSNPSGFERGTPKYQKADYGFSIEHKGVLCKVYLPVSVRQGNVKYLPFKNGNALWLKDLYPNRF